jgi:hypothetical protein
VKLNDNELLKKKARDGGAIFEPKRELTGRWRNLHAELFHNLYFSSSYMISVLSGILVQSEL